MKYSILSLHQTLTDLARAKFSHNVPDLPETSFFEETDWAPTPKKELGDFSIPCFKLAKMLRKSPPQLAAELCQAFEDSRAGTGDVSVPDIHSKSHLKAVGPYINVIQNTEDLLQRMRNELNSNFGSLGIGKGKTFAIDFSSPNVAKEIGLHHLRSTAIGNSISSILTFQGARVERINYLGDWGTSFGKLILGLQMFGQEEELKKQGLSYMLDLYVQFNKAEKEDADLSAKAKETFRRLESGDAELRRIWQLFRDTSIEQFQIVYDRLGIRFDHFDGESLYEGKIDTVVEQIHEKLGTRMSEGALVCDLPDHDIPILLKKDDGASLYITRDLAAAEDRHQRFAFDESLYVVAIQQKLHFKQLFDLCKALGKDYADKMEHISFGMLAFGSKTMKSREGNSIFLRDALDEGKERALELIRQKNPDLPEIEKVADQIGMGALIFSDLSQNKNHTINFEWDKALSFEGDTAPFIQYTHARCTSLIERTQEHSNSLTSETEETGVHSNPAVKNLLLAWDQFEIYAERAYLHKDPSQIASATLAVAKSFNQLYHAIRFLDVHNKSELETLQFLTSGTKQILALGLSLLGIQAPNKM